MSAPSGSLFSHAALIVDSDDSLRTRLLPALHASLDRELPILMVVGPHIARVVREGLGRLSDRVEWGEPSAFYQRLGFAFEGFRRYLAAQYAQGRPVHVVAEPDIATDADDPGPVDRTAAYLPYESMCNQVYAAYGCPVTCIWDSRRHPTLVIENVRSLHTHEVTDTGRMPTSDHVTPAQYLAGRNDIPLTMPPPVTDLDLTLFGVGDLSALRMVIGSWAEEASFTVAAADDVVIAGTEVTTNALVHGSAPVRVRAWQHAETLVVQIDDSAGRPLPAYAGYLPPNTDAECGRGLWLARQLADVLTVHTGGGITSVRLYFPYGVTHRSLRE